MSEFTPTPIDFYPLWRAEGGFDGYAPETRLRAIFQLPGGQCFHMEAYQVENVEGIQTAVNPLFESCLEGLSRISEQPCETTCITFNGVERAYIIVAFPFSS
jgi:hypothetical protein